MVMNTVGYSDDTHSYKSAPLKPTHLRQCELWKDGKRESSIHLLSHVSSGQILMMTEQ